MAIEHMHTGTQNLGDVQVGRYVEHMDILSLYKLVLHKSSRILYMEPYIWAWCGCRGSVLFQNRRTILEHVLRRRRKYTQSWKAIPT